MPSLVEFVSTNSTLTGLQFPVSSFSEEAMIKLFGALVSNNCLQSLSLGSSKLTDQVMPSLVEFVSTNSTLKAIHLPKSSLSDDGAEKILQALCNNTSLLGLSLYESNLTDMVVPSLVNFLSKSKMLFLQFNDSVFSDNGMERMLTALVQNLSLLYLGLWKCPLTDQAVPGLVHFLRKNTTLQSLKILSSTFSDSGMEQILHGLACNQSLQKLSLRESKLTDQVAPALANFLTCNTTLQTLQFTHCCFSDAGMEQILQALAANQSLQALSLFKNELTDKVTPVLAQLVKNKKLQNIRIIGGQLSNDTTEALLTALGQQQVLTDFRINVGCKLTDAAVPVLCDFLARNTHKKTLVLRSKMTDDEVTDELTRYLNMDKLFSQRSKEKSLPVQGTVMRKVKSLTGGKVVTSDSGIASAQVMTADSDVAVPVGKANFKQDAGFVDDIDDDEISTSDEESLQKVVLRSKMTDNEVTDELSGYLKMDKPFSQRSKEKSLPVQGTVMRKVKSLTGGKVVSSDSGIASAQVMTADSDAAEPVGKVNFKQDDGFVDNIDDDEISTSDEESLQKVFPEHQVTPRENLPVVLDLEGQESSDSTSSTTEDGEASFGDLVDVLPEKKAAGLFFSGEGGVLQVPGSDVILRVSPQAVPAEKVYVIHGTIHTNLRDYNAWMSSEDEYIVGPVAEFRVESGEAFDEPVEVVIPHCVRPDKMRNMRVLCGTGGMYRVIRMDDSDIKYCIESHCVRIFTKHFTRFIVTNSGIEEEITDALLTIAASSKNTLTEATTCFRLMLHSGCSMMNDFSDFRRQFYDPDMEEIVRNKVRLPESEDAILPPTIHIELNVDTQCDATIWEGDSPKKSCDKVQGRDVLRLPKHGQNRSENLSSFTLDGSQDEPCKCSIKVTFDYGKDNDPVVHRFKLVYPPMGDGAGGVSQGGHSSTSELTYLKMKEYITHHKKDIMDRLDPSLRLEAALVAAKVIGPAETNKLKAEGISPHERTIIILEAIVKKGVNTFLDFCLVLDKDDIQQTYIVTEVMGLSIDYIKIQRALHGPRASTSVQSSTSAAAASTSTSTPQVALSPTPAAAVPQATSREPPQSVRQRAAGSSSMAHSGIPRPARPRKATRTKQPSASGKSQH